MSEVATATSEAAVDGCTVVPEFARATRLQMDRERSEELSRAVGARNKECWRNSVLALIAITASLSESERAEAVYVEGYAAGVDIPLPVEHGWVQIGRGDGATLIETTPAYLERPHHYYPGRCYTKEDVYSMIDQPRRYRIMPYVANDGRRLNDDEFRAAYDAVCMDVFGRTMADFMAFLKGAPGRSGTTGHHNCHCHHDTESTE